MPLPVVSFSTYLTAVDGVSWRTADYDARNFVHAIKDHDIATFACVRRGTEWREFDNWNRQEVVFWFADMVAEYFGRHPLPHPFILVPVPGSQADLRFDGPSRMAAVARAIAGQLPAASGVQDVLRWESPMLPATACGGRRDAAFLYERLRITTRLNGKRVVLVDDVVTTGGHLRACAARLRSEGTEALLGICAGRADPVQAVDPFAVRQEELDDFEP
jgi:hypothetical protein